MVSREVPLRVPDETDALEVLSEIEVSGPAGNETLGLDGLFLMIGGDPLIASLENWLDVDERGFLLTPY